MGVRDYTCCVCGAPQAYACGEEAGTACRVTGAGDDEAFLTFHAFPAGEAPDTPEAFLAAAPRALRREAFAFGYDWGAWEFVPSLGYREVDDERGIWELTPHDDLAGHPVEVDVPKGERVWIVNCCANCWARFVGGEPGETCRLYEEQVAEHLGVPREAITAAVQALGILPGPEVHVQTPVKVERRDLLAEQERRIAERRARRAASEAPPRLILPGQPAQGASGEPPPRLILPPERRPPGSAR